MTHAPKTSRSLSLVTLCAFAALGSALGCDTADDGSDEFVLLDQSLEVDESEPSEEALALMAELELEEPDEPNYVGPASRVDSLTADDDPTGFVWKNWHSEETPGASYCGADEVLTGFDCDGSYCDNVRLECHDYGTTVLNNGSWSAWFEYNGKFKHECPPGTKVTGIDCWGSYCDNITIRCTSAPGLDTARCGWSGWYSEENPSPLYAPNGSAIQGIWCNGTHCDNKAFLICEV